MNLLQHLRRRLATRRAALGTIALVERHNGVPEALVDATICLRSNRVMQTDVLWWRGGA